MSFFIFARPNGRLLKSQWLIGSLVPVINDIYQVRSLIIYCVNMCFEL